MRHPPIGQNVVNIVLAVNEVPDWRWYIIVRFGANIVNYISWVYAPKYATTTCVLTFPTTVTKTGGENLPESKLSPNFPTIVSFCLKPSILLFQPSPQVSAILIVRMIEFRLGHKPIGQKVLKIVLDWNIVPGCLWYIMVPFGALIMKPI